MNCDVKIRLIQNKFSGESFKEFTSCDMYGEKSIAPAYSCHERITLSDNGYWGLIPNQIESLSKTTGCDVDEYYF